MFDNDTQPIFIEVPSISVSEKIKPMITSNPVKKKTKKKKSKRKTGSVNGNNGALKFCKTTSQNKCIRCGHLRVAGSEYCFECLKYMREISREG